MTADATWTRLWRVLALGMMASAGSSCATAQYRLYDGPPRPSAEIAILCGGGGMGLSQSLRLWTVDGKDGPTEIGYGDTSNGAFCIELRPGHHTLRVGFLNLASAPGALVVVEKGADQTLDLDARAGGSYEIVVDRAESGFVATIEEQDE